jgi:hypothetical protein
MEYRGFPIKVGTQDFTYESICSKNTDIKFQMGFLTEEQKLRINHKQLIGLAERTSYDPKLLKGKGFIYISAESGEFRSASPNMHPTPWSAGKNLPLQYVLYHEVGHIFGLQDGFHDSAEVMWAFYPQNLTNKESVHRLSRHKGRVDDFMPLGCNKNLEREYTINDDEELKGSVPSLKSQNSSNRQSLDEFLGIGPEKRFRLTSSSTGLVVTDLSTNRVTGTIKYGRHHETLTDYNQVISIYLTKEQTLYPNLPKEFLNKHQGLYWQRSSLGFKDEEFRLTNGNSLKVFVKFDSNCFATVGGVYEGDVYFDLLMGF